MKTTRIVCGSRTARIVKSLLYNLSAASCAVCIAAYLTAIRIGPAGNTVLVCSFVAALAVTGVSLYAASLFENL